MDGIIFNVQKFCVNDGPGIRTTVFLKGCPIKCVWCHNPESQKSKAEIMFYADKCMNCGRCAVICKKGCHVFENGVHTFERENCAECFECIKTECGVLEKAGRTVSAEEIISDVMKDKIFYDNSNGGITLSGGEPLYQFDFSLELLKRSKEYGLNTAIETCGFGSADKIKQIAEYVDLFLFDFKETNSKLHKEFTGVGNEIIITNLKILNEMGKNIILRCPIIPGYNNRKEHFEGIGKIAESLENILHIEVEPYHSLGENKYSSLGYGERKIIMPCEEEKQRYIKEIKKNTEKEVKFA